jgi:hypothetical protein
VDAQAGAPEHDDQPTEPLAVGAIAGGAHDRDDLLDGRRIGRVAKSLVARRAPGVEAGRVAGERRRPAASSSSSVIRSS